jgi:hypothetical protein
MELTTSDEQVFAPEVLVFSILSDGQITIHTNKLEDRRSIISYHCVVKIVVHVPSDLNVNVVTMSWYRIVRPIGRI